VSRKRLYHHINAGKAFNESDNQALVEKAAFMLNDELQGIRDVTVLPDGRLTLATKANVHDQDVKQQALSLLIGAQAETEALRGRSMQPNMLMSPGEKELESVLHELIGRGLLHPDALAVASRGFRHPSRVSTDDLSEKFITDVIQLGRGYDPETGAAFNKQYTESGHILDDNLYPEYSHDINNVSPQARIVNQVTADSAKGNSAINPKYKSIIDQRNKGMELIKSEYESGYVDPNYTDDGDSDIYGSALDDLISDLRKKDPRYAGDAAPVLQALKGRTGDKGIDNITQDGKNVTINAENVYMEKAVNGNGKHK